MPPNPSAVRSALSKLAGVAPAARPSSALSSLAARVESASPAIRAFHGSPYSFDRFDASKLGTGEGSQAYGSGLYFAGNERVAKSYRSDGDLLLRDGRPVRANELLREMPFSDGASVVALDAIRQGIDPAEALRTGRGAWKDFEIDPEEARNVVEYLQKNPLSPNPRHMYEVEIGHPESSILDLDAPIRTQGPRIQEFADSVYASPMANGRRLYDLVTESDAPTKAEAAMAAKKLFDAGIPGARYKDAFSRNGGAGSTSNYVMYPGSEDSIRILRKYGILAPVPAAAMTEE